MDWVVSPKNGDDKRDPAEKNDAVDLGKSTVLGDGGGAGPSREPQVQEPGEELPNSADMFVPTLESLSRYFDACEERRFDKNVADLKKKIEEKTSDIRGEIITLKIQRWWSLRGGALDENSGEKTTKEKILEALSSRAWTAKEICVKVYPWFSMSSRERELALKSTRMCLLRLSGRKGKHGRHKDAVVGCIEKEHVNYYYLDPREGVNRLRFLQGERIKTGNRKALNEQMSSILRLAEEYVSDIKQMIALNVEGVRRLKYSVSVNSVYHARGARIEDLALGLVEVQKMVIESPSDSRVDTFLGAIEKLLDAGTGEVIDSGNVAGAREVEKSVEDYWAGLHQIDEENRADFNRRIKELEESMTKKMAGTPYYECFVERRGSRKNKKRFNVPSSLVAEKKMQTEFARSAV